MNKSSMMFPIFLFFAFFFVIQNSYAGTRVIMVDPAFNDLLQTEIAQLQEDYEAEGSEVLVIEVPENKPFTSWTAHHWVKDYLSSISDLEGAILLGNVPTGWFASSTGSRPSDVVFRLPDATFIDADGDGIYESYEGDTKAMIPIGRVTPLNGTWQIEEPVEQIRTYLQRIHQARTGLLEKPLIRGLNYIDSPFGRLDGATPITGPMEELYGVDNVTTVADQSVGPAYDVTTPEDFISYLENPEGFEFVTLHVHGNPAQSVFHAAGQNGGSTQTGSINSVDYRLLDTYINWYLFTSCSTCNYGQTFNGMPEVQSDFLCGSAMHGGQTLGVIAPSFSVAMEYAEEIFDALKIGTGVGLAMNQWFNYSVEDYDRAPDSTMLKGFQLMGDPWLHSDKPPQISAFVDRIILYRPGSFQAWILSRWLLPRLGLVPPRDQQSNLLLWTFSEKVQAVTVAWEIKERWQNTFPQNIKNQRIVRVASSPRWTGLGGWVTERRDNATYSVRPVFLDGNVGAWTKSCSVNHQSNPWVSYTDCK